MRSKTVKKLSKKLSKKSSKKSTKTIFKCVNCGLTFKTQLGLDAHKLLFGIIVYLIIIIVITGGLFMTKKPYSN